MCDLPAKTCAYTDLSDLWPGGMALLSKHPQPKGYSWLCPNAVACSLLHQAAAYLYFSHMAKHKMWDSDHLILDAYRYLHPWLII